MKVTTELRDQRQLAMTVEVDQERVDQELRKAARTVSQRYNIPGFRKGRVPYSVLVRHVGLPTLYEEFLDDLGQEVFREAIEQENIEPYAVAAVEDIELDPLRYTLVVPLAPDARLGDYRSLRVEEQPVEVDEEALEARLEELRERFADYGEVERPSQFGDLMNIDVKAIVLDEEGNPTDTVVLEEEDWDVTPDQDNPMQPPGFDEALIDIIPGEEKEFVLRWPEDSQSIFAGKQARFQVKLKTIQAYQKPELDDELAQLAGPEFETLEQLKESIRDSLREQASRQAEDAYLEKALDKLVEISELEYPPVAIEQQIDHTIANMENYLRQMGVRDIDHYLEMTGQSMEAYRETLRKDAERATQHTVVLSKLAEEEGLQVSDEEFEERLATMFGEQAEGPATEAADEEHSNASGGQNMVEMMRSGPGRTMVENQILTEKTTQRLLAIARGEEIPGPGEDTKSVGEEKQQDESDPGEEAEAVEPPANMMQTDN